MPAVFTDDEFKGINFSCDEATATVGWYHVAKAINDSGEVVAETKIHYYNRTWESFKYQTVLERLKDKLRKLQKHSQISIDYELWSKLIDEGIIEDYGTDQDDDYYVLVYSCEQADRLSNLVDKDNELSDEDKELLESCGIDRNRLIEQWDNLFEGTLYTDEYVACSECGHFTHNTEIVELDGQFICEECLRENPEYIHILIEKAQEDFKQAVPALDIEEQIKEQGFEFIQAEEEYGGDRIFGEYQFEDMSEVYLAQDIHNKIDGAIIVLTGVGQFQTYFKIAVPSEHIVKAQAIADGDDEVE